MNDPRWHAPGSADLIVEPLDSLTALFDRRSGQTHLLAPPLPEILAVLADGPATATTIAARLSVQFDLAAEGDLAEGILARLAELEVMGLVARQASGG
jgi:PqqD family protein of HPr-rel-A system